MHTRFLLVLLITLLFCSAPSHAAPVDSAEAVVPARKPLTYKDSGIYGWWQPYFWEGPFDFVIAQAFLVDHESLRPSQNGGGAENAKKWNEYLLKARAAGKRVIVLTTPGHGQHLSEEYFEGLITFLENVDHEEIYAITLSEEHIFWDGRAEQMTEGYHRVKEKFPDLPIYQFYSNTSRATARPGFVWPWVPADGWMIDEYSATPDDFEQQLRRYRMLGQPVINIVWAAPFYSSSKQTGVQYHHSIFNGKLRISEKYDLPTAFFCWDGPAGAGDRGWPWEEAGHEETKKVFNMVLDSIEKADALPDAAVIDWDANDAPEDTVLTNNPDGDFAYRESFNLRMKEVDPDYKVEYDFMARSLINGLRHMQWVPGLPGLPDATEPNRIIIRADESGAADAALTQRWSTPDNETCRFTASARFAVAPTDAATAVFEVSANGYDWESQATAVDADGVVSIALKNPQDHVYTRLRVASESAEPGTTLAEIDWIEVKAVPAP